MLPIIDQYMHIWFLASVLLVTPMIGNAILRANGDTKTPSLIMGGSGLINAILDPVLIFGWGPIPALGVQGAPLPVQSLGLLALFWCCIFSLCVVNC